jgi:hypothetical protein
METMRADDVCAIIVTRGDVDLEPVLAPLPYGEVIVWNNAERLHDMGSYGRYCAIDQTDKDVIYFQDDDCIITCHDQLLDAYEDGKIVSNMPEEHSGGLYRELDTCLLGWGSLTDRNLPEHAFERWFEYHPRDDAFLRIGADFVFPMLTPCKRIYHGHESLEYAWDDTRTWRTPGYEAARADYLMLALELRLKLEKERSTFV